MSRNDIMAQEEFSKAIKKARFQTLLSRLQLERTELLSFYDIKELVKPKQQNYRGVKPIPISQIIGSEGRFNDFTNAFYPKKYMLKGRWASISSAHRNMVDLPAISVYKLGNAYFVRDGNHRVSVARATGGEFIDAEIVELDSEIELEPGMTDRQIRDKVVAYERKRVLKKTGIGKLIDMDAIRFSAPGQYTEMLHHIEVHKYFINMSQKEEIPFDQAVVSWYRNVYLPVAEAIKEQKLTTKFPGLTVADLYMWVVKHWNSMKDRSGQGVAPTEASRDYAEQNKLSLFRWIAAWVRKTIARIKK